MSSADYGERGGTAALRASSADQSPADHSHFSAPRPSSSLDDTDSLTWSSLGPQTANTSSTNLSPANLSSAATSNTNSNPSQLTKPTASLSPNLDLSTSDAVARNELLLRDAVYPA